MTQSQFFGMNIGQKVYDSYSKCTFTLHGVLDEDLITHEGLYATNYHRLSDCKLILKLMSEMEKESDEFKMLAVESVYNYGVKWSSDESCLDNFEHLFPKNENFIHKGFLEFCTDNGYDIFDGRSRGWVVYENEIVNK